eukprot:6388724-Prymnesium_polylepis.2
MARLQFVLLLLLVRELAFPVGPARARAAWLRRAEVGPLQHRAALPPVAHTSEQTALAPPHTALSLAKKPVNGFRGV